MSPNALLNKMNMQNKNFKQCAAEIGVSKATFTKIMRGERDLTLTEANILGDFLGMTTEDRVNIFLL